MARWSWLFAMTALMACGESMQVGSDDVGSDGVMPDASPPPPDADCPLPCDDAPLPDASTPDAPPDAAPPDAAPDAPPPDAPSITGSALQLNDVSIVLPLPTSNEDRDTHMLAATAAGPRGALFPQPVYAAIDTDLGGFSFEMPYSALRVIAVRIDPCFGPVLPPADESTCEAQLRLVLQPIVGASSALETRDAAIHTFYRLTREQLYAAKDTIVALRLASSGGEALGPLAPHPIIVQQGLGGTFHAGLRALILEVAGADNLTRVATMHKTASQTWSFTIFDIASTSPVEIARRTIAAVAAGTTTQSGNAFNLPSLDAAFQPPPIGPDAFNDLASALIAVNLTPEVRRAQFDGLIRVENPHVNTPDTVSCVTCHFAMIVKKRIAEPRFGLFDSSSPDVYTPIADLLAPGELRPTFSTTTFDFNIHAFSYLGTDLAIAQRTVNESAAVLEYFAASPTP